MKKKFKKIEKIQKKRQNSHGKKTISRAEIAKLSSEYYTLIPHSFGFSVPPPINKRSMIKKEMELLESLSEIQIATHILSEHKKIKQKHIIDEYFETLNCQCQPLNTDDTEFKIIQKYVKTNHCVTHNSYTLEVKILT